MDINELKADIVNLIDTRERHEALKTAKAETFKRMTALEHKVTEAFINNQIPAIEIEGVGNVKASFAQNFTILGGKTAPEKRLRVLRNLVELGYLDEEKVTEHRALEFVAENTLAEVDAAEVHEGSLQAAFRKVPYEILQGWVEEKLITITPEPSVQIRAVKKSAA